MYFFFIDFDNLVSLVFSHLLSKIRSFERDHTTDDCVSDEAFIIHEFVRRERGHSVQEQVGGRLEVPYGHTVDTAVNLEAVPPIPITTFLDQTGERGYDIVNSA